MKKLFLLLALAISYNVSSQSNIKKNYYEDGKLKETIEYRDNVMHGKREMFSSDGTSLGVMYYKDGIEHWLEDGIEVVLDEIYQIKATSTEEETYTDELSEEDMAEMEAWMEMTEEEEAELVKTREAAEKKEDSIRMSMRIFCKDLICRTPMKDTIAKDRLLSVEFFENWPPEELYENARENNNVYTSENKKLAGRYYVLNDNDAVVASLAFKEGQIEGNCYYYNPESGFMSASLTLKNGRLEGEKFSYDYKGYAEMKTTFKNGIRHGEYLYWYQGVPYEQLVRVNFQNGNRSGLRTCTYLMNGQIASEGHYYPEIIPFNNELDDAETRSGDGGDGDVMSTPIGRHTRYYPDGEIKEVTNYYNGVITGKVIYYDDAGKIQGVAVYRNGVEMNCDGRCYFEGN